MTLASSSYVEPKDDDWDVEACTQEAGPEGSAGEPESMEDIIEKIHMIKREGSRSQKRRCHSKKENTSRSSKSRSRPALEQALREKAFKARAEAGKLKTKREEAPRPSASFSTRSVSVPVKTQHHAAAPSVSRPSSGVQPVKPAKPSCKAEPVKQEETAQMKTKQRKSRSRSIRRKHARDRGAGKGSGYKEEHTSRTKLKTEP